MILYITKDNQKSNPERLLFWYNHSKQQQITACKFRAYWVIGKIQNRCANRIKNSLGNKPDTLLFETRFPNNLFQLVMDIDHQRKTLFGKSFRIKN